MISRNLFILLSILSLQTMIGCLEPAIEKSKRDDAIKEIGKAEENFATLCSKEGVQKAFATFSDDSAHIRSNDSLISGKLAIESYYSRPFFKSVSIEWKPDFIDASESGDMGYTYGRYTFIIKDYRGKKTESKGIFHTVWKKKNGVWKFVCDS